MIKNVLKFSIGAIGIIVLGFAVLYFIRTRLPEYNTIENVTKVKKQYAEDLYGGATPRETLQLFIDALKNGDTKLAEKYFASSVSQHLGEELAQIKDKNLLSEAVTELQQLRLTREDADRAYFTREHTNDSTGSQIVLIKNPINGRWEIIEF